MAKDFTRMTGRIKSNDVEIATSVLNRFVEIATSVPAVGGLPVVTSKGGVMVVEVVVVSVLVGAMATFLESSAEMATFLESSAKMATSLESSVAFGGPSA